MIERRRNTIIHNWLLEIAKHVISKNRKPKYNGEERRCVKTANQKLPAQNVKNNSVKEQT